MHAYIRFLNGCKEDKYCKKSDNFYYKTNSSLPDNVYSADNIVYVRILLSDFFVSSEESS